MNSVQLIGRLTRDPEMRFTGGGDPVANFSVAVDRAGDKTDEGYDPGFFNCVAFGKTASLIEEFFHKGKQIGVEGRLQHHKWTSQDGENKQQVQIIVSNITFTGSKADSEGGRGDQDPNQFVPAGANQPGSNVGEGGSVAQKPDMDIPF